MKLKINDYVKVKGEGYGYVTGVHFPNHVEVKHTDKVYPLGVNYLQDGFYTTQETYYKIYDSQDVEKVERDIILDDVADLLQFKTLPSLDK